MVTETTLNDITLLVGAFIYVLVVIGISMVLKKKDVINGHAARKIVHLTAGFSVFIVPYLSTPHLSMIISILFLVVCRLSKPKTPVFEMMAEKDERDLGYLGGPFSYALSINILVFIFSFQPLVQYFYFPASTIMIMMISDTLAAFYGRKYGKINIKIKWTKTVRTLEGSLVLMISAFGLSVFGFAFFGTWFPVQNNVLAIDEILILSAIVGVIAAVTEVLSPSNQDDLTMPITTCFLSFLITAIAIPGFIGL